VGEKGTKIRDIEQLRDLLGKSPIPIKSAFLFGSRACGDYLEESDWDIMIVSPEFADIPFVDRATAFLKKVPLRRAELLCYTEEELQERAAELGIVAEASKGMRLI
jgi:hypothetical protein